MMEIAHGCAPKGKQWKNPFCHWGFAWKLARIEKRARREGGNRTLWKNEMWNISGGKWPPCCVASSAGEKAVSKGHLSYNSLDIDICIAQMDLSLDFQKCLQINQDTQQNKPTNQNKTLWSCLCPNKFVCWMSCIELSELLSGQLSFPEKQENMEFYFQGILQFHVMI